MTNILIYGSCVSRDTAEFLGDITVRCYVARQSMISAVHGNADVDGEIQLDSAFQRRGVRSDFRGDAFERLSASASQSDVLLIDILDERLGVFQAPNKAYFTHTWELQRSTFLETQPSQPAHIQFATPEHFDIWSASLNDIAPRLASLNLPTLVLAPQLAERDLDGNQLTYRNRSVASWNSDFDSYYEEIEKSELDICRPPVELAVADKDHKWGLAPFHYAAPMYEWFATKIEQKISLRAGGPS